MAAELDRGHGHTTRSRRGRSSRGSGVAPEGADEVDEVGAAARVDLMLRPNAADTRRANVARARESLQQRRNEKPHAIVIHTPVVALPKPASLNVDLDMVQFDRVVMFAPRPYPDQLSLALCAVPLVKVPAPLQAITNDVFALHHTQKSLTVITQLLEVSSRQSLVATRQKLSATAMMSDCMFRCVLECAIAKHKDSRSVRLLEYIDSVRYDETPMKVSVLQGLGPESKQSQTTHQLHAILSAEQPLALFRLPTKMMKTKASDKTKIIQSMSEYGMLVELKKPGEDSEFVCFVGADLGEVQVADRTTAEVLATCTLEASRVGLGSKQFEHATRLAGLDGFKANTKAERWVIMKRGAGWGRLEFTCCVHTLSNAHTKTL